MNPIRTDKNWELKLCSCPSAIQSGLLKLELKDILAVYSVSRQECNNTSLRAYPVQGNITAAYHSHVTTHSLDLSYHCWFCGMQKVAWSFLLPTSGSFRESCSIPEHSYTSVLIKLLHTVPSSPICHSPPFSYPHSFGKRLSLLSCWWGQMAEMTETSFCLQTR